MDLLALHFRQILYLNTYNKFDIAQSLGDTKSQICMINQPMAF